MDFKTKYATYRGCEFQTGRYCNGNLALQVVSETEGPKCICSVNPGVQVPDDMLAIKDHSENEGMVNILTEMGIIGERRAVIESGYVKIPVHALTEKGRALFGFKEDVPTS